ncbi:hypothetical protein UJ101_00598 [Flavobacteriaceae bacterium UJ101]|nr:hypothetical protein UJ101_00598 [Flavobacteriaceae bacterium UJ101]
MASIKNLKKDVNFILADIIEDCLIWQLENPKKDAEESEKIISDSIDTFDQMIVRINEKGVENKKVHFRAIVKDLKESVGSLLERVNKL